MTSPITELAVPPNGWAAASSTTRVEPGRPRRGARGRRRAQPAGRPDRASCWPASARPSPTSRTGCGRRSPRCAWTPTALRDTEERGRLGADVDDLTRQVDALIREARAPVRERRRGALRRPRGRRGPGRVLAGAGRGPGPARSTWRCRHRGRGPRRARLTSRRRWTRCSATSSRTRRRAPPSACRCSAPAAARSRRGRRRGSRLHRRRGALGRGESLAGSTGLGLDIARRTAVASGGEMTVDRSPSGGTRVVMRLGPPTVNA